MENVSVNGLTIGEGQPLCVIGGPDVIEDQDTLDRIAETMCALTADLGISYIFKASYTKDNRGSASSYQGPGLKQGLEMLAKVRDKFGCPITSDSHNVDEIDAAAEVLDLLQVPAYLCQQTSLVLKFGASGKPVNVKKGQFVAPSNMSSAVGKIRSTGNHQVLVTERGTCFGYNKLISDMTCIPILRDLGVPVVYDATHIIRNYGYPSEDMEHGGSPEFVPALVRAGVAAGANALFLETHPTPEVAQCDASSMWRLEDMPGLLQQAKTIHDVMRGWGEA